MAQRNPTREIAFSLLAAAVFGAGMFIYLRSTIPDAEELKSHMTVPVPSAERPEASLHERATSVAQRFINAVKEKRFRDAHAMTTRAYQNAVGVAEFQSAVEASPYLVTAKEVSFVRVSQQTMTLQDGTPAQGPVMGRGMLVSDHGNADISFTLTPEEDTLHVLVITTSGVPIFSAMLKTP
jgi:hypothetical protein